MKYMHFNSSCPYAGLANMLALAGHDTEDFQIAIDMNLPLLLHYDQETGYYQAGASLQSARWFNLYLNPRGYRYVEAPYAKGDVLSLLKPGTMLGMEISPQSRHAVVFLGEENGIYRFLNNKWESTPEPELLDLSPQECLERLSDRVIMGHLEQQEASPVDFIPLFKEALATWDCLRMELLRFIACEQSPQAMREAMNRLFRPLLLDGLTMLQLLGCEEQVQHLTELQGKFLQTIRRGQATRLSNDISPADIHQAIDGFTQLITEKMDATTAQSACENNKEHHNGQAIS